MENEGPKLRTPRTMCCVRCGGGKAVDARGCHLAASAFSTLPDFMPMYTPRHGADIKITRSLNVVIAVCKFPM